MFSCQRQWDLVTQLPQCCLFVKAWDFVSTRGSSVYALWGHPRHCHAATNCWDEWRDEQCTSWATYVLIRSNQLGFTTLGISLSIATKRTKSSRSLHLNLHRLPCFVWSHFQTATRKRPSQIQQHSQQHPVSQVQRLQHQRQHKHSIICVGTCQQSPGS